ncbi:MAG: SUMF1/EgtB/PvdO family nonheme iron enzyme [Chloroflexi bacterium]|nr:SUMF1/EgtB/PvdO family nonheme iron enzyme [Chloroflexota bacterium]
MVDQEQMTPEQKIVWDKINQMMDVSYGCAEAFVAAVGEYLWGEVDDSIKMISTGFSGGVGGTHEELCGGVSGAAIILGLLYGRTTNDEALMIRCKRLISEQRDRFVQEFGTTVCQELRDAQFGADEDNPCSAMIAPAAFILLDILEEEKEREALAEKDQGIDDSEYVLSLEEFIDQHRKDQAESLFSELQRIELPHNIRDWIGIQLDQIGDPRAGIGLTTRGLPSLVMQSVPAGKVNIERAGEYQVDELMISKYALTTKQFQIFLDDPEGFINPIWWEGLTVDEDHKKTPGEQRFQENNHPRDNVSWFDAVAFCRWLNDRLQKIPANTELPFVELMKENGWEIRLPTEWEWQMAATGGDPKNKFPWGLDWDDRLAHTKHNQLNKSLAVGMYPAGISPVGALDMSGNVWEWCLNCYENSGEIDLGRTDRRVLRGGSWYHWGSYAHTDMRSRYFPDHRYNAGGFRIACGKPID